MARKAMLAIPAAAAVIIAKKAMDNSRQNGDGTSPLPRLRIARRARKH